MTHRELKRYKQEMLSVLAGVVIVEVAAVAVVNGIVHATLSDAVDLTVHREIFQLHFRLEHALPDAWGYLSHRFGAIT
jgi:predicted lysophospholipase L1 biosynthesis ABC-type transport system permease subunit